MAGICTLTHAMVPLSVLFEDGMNRSTSISIWSVIGFILGGFLLQVFFALLFADTGLPSYYGQVILIGVVDIILSFCAAYFNGKSLSFVVGYTTPFVLLALFNTISLLYVRSVPSHIKGILFSWGCTAVIFLIGFAGGHIGLSLGKRRNRTAGRETGM